jgi:hypothetical protein
VEKRATFTGFAHGWRVEKLQNSYKKFHLYNSKTQLYKIAGFAQKEGKQK